MKLRSKEPYWLLKNGLLNSYPSLQHDALCDVLIIGGGITGALVCYQLSKEGYKTVLIDKRDIGMGSTSATTAMIQYEIDEPLFKLIDAIGETAAVDCYLEGVRAIDRLVEITKEINTTENLEKKDSLYIANSDADAKWLMQEYTVREKFNLPVSWLSKAQLMEIYGVVGKGAILSQAGASLDAYHFTHQLITYCKNHLGAAVFDHTTLAKVEYLKNGCVAVTDSDVKVNCKHIVYASGYETHSLIKKKIVKLLSTYAFVSEPLTDLPLSLKSSLFWNTEDPYLYLRCTNDNRILVGGGDEKFKNPKLRDQLIEKKEFFLLEKTSHFLPGIKLIPDFSWAGTFGVTKDALPYIGSHPDFPRSFFLLGFGGNGITFSVMGMKILSDAIAGRANKFLEYFRFNR